ncbi:MAG TPA: hypothetical protein VJ583_00210 [Nitrososphaeraceae archaeon]|nr:hypothetical protein [Nitrososphaeraceae archaeon]
MMESVTIFIDSIPDDNITNMIVLIRQSGYSKVFESHQSLLFYHPILFVLVD